MTEPFDTVNGVPPMARQPSRGVIVRPDQVGGKLQRTIQ
jgi:hypothetical protein